MAFSHARISEVVCHKCNQTGHRQNDCPLNSVIKAIGIPKNKLQYVSADTPNAMLTSNGKWAIVKQPV